MIARHTEAIDDAHRVLTAYDIRSSQLTPIACGLINLTWRVTTTPGLSFILQRLHPIFPPTVNLNLERVTRHLAARGMPTPRLMATCSGNYWVEDANATWRVLSFVAGESFARVPDLEHAHSAGRLLGAFHAALRDFDGQLPFVRAPVHAPRRHVAALAEALATGRQHRLQPAVTAIANEVSSAIAVLPAIAETPLRLVHGDPKLSNLLFGAGATPICMVDFDTVGYAPLGYELGDAFRSWCNPYIEDGVEADFDLSLFEAAIEGYASATIGYITAVEAHAIVSSTELIALELAARFAADAIHESYFAWDAARFETCGDHNLARARNQVRVAASLRRQVAAAAAAVQHAFDVRP
ncbi:MAG: phosphotransferase enzyme family protein [Gammaproteobacteria bacterium]